MSYKIRPHQSALSEAALCFCKIYEREGDRYELNSIWGIIRSLQELRFTDTQIYESQKFSSAVGAAAGDDVVQNLRSAMGKIIERHAPKIERLRTFRDKFAAHSEHGFSAADLPSHDEFEALYDFAYHFYRFVSEHVVQVVPALIGRQVGMDLVRHFKNLGIEGILWDFPH